MNEQRIEVILEIMKKMPLILIREADSQEIIDLKLECLMLLRDNIDLLLKCAKERIERADEGWNNWLKRHGVEE